MAKRRRRAPDPPQPVTIGQPLSEPVILAAANWVRDTTLLYGGSISTAFFCAAYMAKGLEEELQRRLRAPDAGPGAGEG